MGINFDEIEINAVNELLHDLVVIFEANDVPPAPLAAPLAEEMAVQDGLGHGIVGMLEELEVEKLDFEFAQMMTQDVLAQEVPPRDTNHLSEGPPFPQVEARQMRVLVNRNERLRRLQRGYERTYRQRLKVRQEAKRAQVINRKRREYTSLRLRIKRFIHNAIQDGSAETVMERTARLGQACADAIARNESLLQEKRALRSRKNKWPLRDIKQIEHLVHSLLSLRQKVAVASRL